MPTTIFFRSVFASLLLTATAGLAIGQTAAIAVNRTMATECAEEDNVNVPIYAPVGTTVAHFTIEARHPPYPVLQDNTTPNFTNCDIDPAVDFTFADPLTGEVYNDGETVVVAHRLPGWWRASGMQVSAPDSRSSLQSLTDTHFIAVHRRSPDGDYPQVMVLYADGNLRLKPYAKTGQGDPAFGSSVVIGPAAESDRPLAEIQTLHYLPSLKAFDVQYASGDEARIQLLSSDRESTVLGVDATFSASPSEPFATFRSMFVKPGNADVDSFMWAGLEGTEMNVGITDFANVQSDRFRFLRETISVHNTSAPDYVFGQFSFAPVPEPSTALLAALALLPVWPVVHRRRNRDRQRAQSMHD